MKPSRRQPHDGVRGLEDRLDRAIVLLELDHLGRRLELSRKVENVAGTRRAKAVDRLRVVADDGKAVAAGPELEQDRGLERVGVLIFVDQNEVEPARDVRGDVAHIHHPRPVEQQIVVVEHVLALLGGEVSAEQVLQLALPLAAPGKHLRQNPLERRLCVDGVGVDREAGLLLGEAVCLAAEPELLAHQIHEVRGIAPVEDREGGIEPDRPGIEAKQARAQGVERARPLDRIRERGDAAERLAADALGPADHGFGGAAGEGEQEDALRPRAADDQMRHPMGKRVRLAGARAGQDQQRWPGLESTCGRHAIGGGGALRMIQCGEIWCFLHQGVIARLAPDAKQDRRQATACFQPVTVAAFPDACERSPRIALTQR